jgi:uncharacterized phage protein gp47/JayE
MPQVTRFKPLTRPTIDPRNEEALVQYGMDRVYSSSGGRINDFSASSPARVLIEGLAFAAAEFLYQANKVLDSLEIQLLQTAGIQQKEGSAAVGTLTFTLTAPLGNVFSIPAGYECKASDRTFSTDELLLIPAGAISGTVAATCTTLGTEGNVGAYAINQLTQPLAFLGNVTNIAAASGGSDGETIEDTKARAFASFRRRGLVSGEDYEQEVRGLLGESSVAIAIGNLSADRTAVEKGVVHIFALNGDGSALNSAQQSDLQQRLQTKTHLTIGVYVSNLEIIDTSVQIVAQILAGENPEAIAIALNRELTAYLSPGGGVGIGETVLVKEIEYIIRSVPGIDYVQAATIGGWLETLYSSNFAIPNRWSAPRMRSFVCTLVQSGEEYIYAFGDGDPD